VNENPGRRGGLRNHSPLFLAEIDAGRMAIPVVEAEE
jgi:hypothetical protein